MKVFFTIILISLLSVNAFSQEILLKQNVKADSVRPTRGPNLKNYLHGYLGAGFPLYTNEGYSYTKPILSSSFDFGIRYKRKITNFLAVGADLGIIASSYKIKQEEGKKVPDIILNKKEKFQINMLVGSAFIRTNVGRRGNYIGNYLDLGGFGGWNMIKKHVTVNQNLAEERVKVVKTRLKYIDDFSYGLSARLGSNRYAITASYRLSDIFKTSSSMAELPHLNLGFEYGLFK